jgi:5-methylcytosine-specific restriction endonuclease McrA
MPTKPPIFRSPFRPAPRPETRVSSWRRGYDRDWQKLRDHHLRNVEPLCRICNQNGQTTAAVLVDHATPIEVAPERRLDPTNLRSLCVNCHNACTGNYRATGVNEPPRAAGAKA